MKVTKLELNVNDAAIVFRWDGDPSAYLIEGHLPMHARETKLFRTAFALYKALTETKYNQRVGKLVYDVIGPADNEKEVVEKDDRTAATADS